MLEILIRKTKEENFNIKKPKCISQCHFGFFMLLLGFEFGISKLIFVLFLFLEFGIYEFGI